MARKFDPLSQPRRRRHTWLLQALVLVALLLIAAALLAPRITASSLAPSTAATPFSGTVLTYRDDSGYARDVTAAAVAWNAVGAHVRLRAVPRGSDADITIKTVTRRKASWAGRATVGCDLDAGPQGPRSILLNRRDMRGSARLAIIVHELGHTLGLSHARGCSVMRPVGPVRCGNADACGPQDADAAALARLWGGTVSGAFRAVGCAQPTLRWQAVS
jgi:hypothetical protein